MPQAEDNFEEEELYEYRQPVGATVHLRHAMERFFSVGLPVAFLAFVYSNYYRPSGQAVLRRPDAVRAALVARSIAEGKGYATTAVSPRSLKHCPRLEKHPAASQSPLYPLLLSMAYRALGSSRLATIGTAAALWAMSMWLTSVLASKWKRPGVLPLAIAFAMASPQYVCCTLQGTSVPLKALLFTFFVGLCSDEFPRAIPGDVPDEDVLTTPAVGARHRFVLGLGAGLLCMSAYSTFFLVLPILMLAAALSGSHWKRAIAPMLLGLCGPLVVWLVVSHLIGVGVSAGVLDHVWHGLGPREAAAGRLFQARGSGQLHLLWIRRWSLLRKFFWNVTPAFQQLIIDVGPALGLIGFSYSINQALRRSGSYRFHGAFLVGVLFYTLALAFGEPIPGSFCLFVPVLSFCASRQIVDWFESATQAVFAVEGPDSSSWLLHEWKRPVVILGSYGLMVGWLAWRCMMPGQLVLPDAAAEPNRSPAPSLVALPRPDARLLRSLGDGLVITDVPEQMAWYYGATSCAMPLAQGDYESILELARREGLAFGGLFLSRPADPLLDEPEFCRLGITRWLATVYNPDLPFKDTSGIRMETPQMCVRVPVEAQPEIPSTADLAAFWRRWLAPVAAPCLTPLKMLEREVRLGNCWPIPGLLLESRPPVASLADVGVALGAALSAQRRYSVARPVLESLAALRPWDADAWAGLLVVYSENGLHGHGACAAAMAARASPGMRLDAVQVAACLSGIGMRQLAYRRLRRSLCNVPDRQGDYPGATARLAEACLETGLLSHAVELAGWLRRSWPSKREIVATALRVQSSALIQFKDWHGAIEVLQELESLEPESPEALSGLARCFERIGQAQMSEPILKRLAKLRGADADLFLLLWRLDSMEPRNTDIESLCREGLKDWPDNPFLKAHLARFLTESSLSLGEAERLARAAVEADPESVFFRDILAWLLYRREQFREAAEVLLPCQHVLWRKPLTCYHWGAIQFELGNRAEARRLLERAILGADQVDAWTVHARRMLSEYQADPILP